LIQPSPLRGQVDHFDRLRIAVVTVSQPRLGCRNGRLQRLGLHQHAGATAERSIIHGTMTIVSEIPWIPATQLHQTLTARSASDAMISDGCEHLGEKSDNTNFHCAPPDQAR